MTLPIVAVAGGTSKLGLAIVQALLQDGAYTALVLSRQGSKTPEGLIDLGVEVRRVDYLSPVSCESAVQGVHTIISTLLCKDGTWYQSQKNLLDAGLKASLKRFVVSEFGAGPSTTELIDLFAQEQLPIRKALQQAAKENTGFEWTAFYNGQFLEYLGFGCERPEANGMDHSLMWDVKAMTADLPVLDDGTVPNVTFTSIFDVARLVSAACTLEHWPEEMYMAGSSVNMMDVVAIIERVRKQQMVVRKHTQSSIQAQIDAIPAETLKEEDLMRKFFLQLSLCFADGVSGKTVMPAELNKMFPEIKMTSVDEYVSRHWAPTV